MSINHIRWQDISVECRQVIHDLLDDNHTVQQEWRFKMIDSSATLGTGILKGTTHFFGDYDECLGIDLQTIETIPMRHTIGNVHFKIRDEYNYMNASIDSSKHLMSARLEQCVHRNDNPIQWLHIIIGQ
ncbi:unnamed protein product [Oppiella nova]|uniref:Nose resistant-to-fluoxetine protein N-terminal domain-containing protein n=1 Tax=Oppiella nova TaxID=334625 RepID=A0A7R9QP69_9ACAR|nr:unnamed protein product [Oppiella nova]CAG2169215.1 unnamed protein product [Oppiella nova]